MPLLAAGSPLVAGGVFPEGTMEMKTVRVVRAFYYQGKSLAVDTVVDLPKLFAAEMCAANKAVAHVRPAPEAKSDTRPEPKREEKKGDTHAR